MKIRLREVLIFGLLFALLVAASALTATDKGVNEPDYTVFSTGVNGVSLVYDTLKKMGYSVESGYIRIDRDSGINDVYIVTKPDPRYFSEDNISAMMEWVYSGGRLIYLDDGDNYMVGMILKNLPGYTDGRFTLYSLGLGEILVGDSEAITNKSVMNDRTGGRLLQGMIDNWGCRKIIFAEYYHGYQSSEQDARAAGAVGIWRDLPGWFKIMTYQLLLVAMLTLWMLGKRFGRPKRYYEEFEREDNEYLSALANIYMNAGMGGMILDSYYNDFIMKCSVFFNRHVNYVRENIVALWREDNLAESEILSEIAVVVAASDIKTKKRGQRKELFRVLKNIKRLSEIIENEER